MGLAEYPFGLFGTDALARRPVCLVCARDPQIAPGRMGPPLQAVRFRCSYPLATGYQPPHVRQQSRPLRSGFIKKPAGSGRFLFTHTSTAPLSLAAGTGGFASPGYPGFARSVLDVSGSRPSALQPPSSFLISLSTGQAITLFSGLSGRLQKIKTGLRP